MDTEFSEGENKFDFKKILPLLAVGVIALGGAFVYKQYYLNSDGSDTYIVVPTSYTFSEEGRLTKDEPGMDKGKWYIVYSSESASNQAIKLKIPSESICSVKGIGKRCSQVELQAGSQVNIQGTLDGDQVVVTFITVL